MEEIFKQIQNIHNADGQAVIVATGAGSQAISWLFSIAGASKTLLDVQIPYSRQALTHYLGKYSSDRHVSDTEALLMADAALDRAVNLSNGSSVNQKGHLSGVSCTAAIATNRTRRGDNRIHIGIATSYGLRKTYSLIFEKNTRDRADEESICSKLLINAVSEAQGLTDRIDLSISKEEKVYEVVR